MREGAAEALAQLVADAIMVVDPNPYHPADAPYYMDMAAAAIEAIVDFLEDETGETHTGHRDNDGSQDDTLGGGALG